MLYKSIIIERSSKVGLWERLQIILLDKHKNVWWDKTIDNSPAYINEADGTKVIVDRFLRAYPDFKRLKPDILNGFKQLQENDFRRNNGSVWNFGIMEISVVQKDQEHISCQENENDDSTTESSGINEISQSELQQKLAVVEKNNKVMKFFEDNQCSVCLSSYKEILDEDLHIVVPSCGHPLCCKCADNILVSEKKQCPRCRGNITAQSFRLMKFNADLAMETQNQTVFL